MISLDIKKKQDIKIVQVSLIKFLTNTMEGTLADRKTNDVI